MTATIKDVAARAGVSTKTVSRVMNGEAHVRPALRDTVMHAVAELGYRPNAFARSLSSARSYLIGMFFDDPASGYATAMQRGALDRCRQSHYHLVVEPLDPNADGWRAELSATLSALKLDGVVLTPPLSQNVALVAMVLDAGVPLVCVSPDPAAPPAAGSVEIDEERAAFDMTGRLIALGHREIGFLEGNPTHASARVRRAGFRAAMAAAGLPVADDRVALGDFEFRTGLASAERMLAAVNPPTAIFASNDDMALGVWVAAVKAGLSVPQALSIAGFDDAPPSRIAWPPIATVRQPVAEMGAAAIGLIVDPAYRDSATPAAHRILLPYGLLERDSIGPPPPIGDPA